MRMSYWSRLSATGSLVALPVCPLTLPGAVGNLVAARTPHCGTYLLAFHAQNLGLAFHACPRSDREHRRWGTIKRRKRRPVEEAVLGLIRLRCSERFHRLDECPWQVLTLAPVAESEATREGPRLGVGTVSRVGIGLAGAFNDDRK